MAWNRCGLWGFLLVASFFLLASKPQVSGSHKIGASSPGPLFVDVTELAGIRFKHESGASAVKYLPETMGSGCAFLDFDQDGFLDILFINGGSTPAYVPRLPIKNVLYRSKGDGTFEDVTEKSGIDTNRAYGMGVATGDYNNDGFPDVYITGLPASTLFQNNGNGTFKDVTKTAGVENRGSWGTSAAWFDYNNDGFLDLIVANYLNYDYSSDRYCGEPQPGYRMYCHPRFFDGVFPTLYRNDNDGTFTDVTVKAGLQQHKSKGLGIVAADFNNDGWVDVFIANDSIRNLFYLNRRNSTFEDITLASGTGYSDDGIPEAGMGVDAGDYNNDGLQDIYVTHLDFELNRLYQNRDGVSFSDVSMVSGLGRTAILNSGFGTRFFDVDHDGWKDLLLINGHVLDNVALYRHDVSYAEKKILYRNAEGRFVNVSGEAGEPFKRLMVGRGLALGDYDRDGDLDLLVSNNNQQGQLIRNVTNTGNHWVGLRLVGVQSNRDGVGARVKLVNGTMTQFDQIKGGASYLSASEPTLYFGLGSSKEADLIEVRWPSGRIDLLTHVRANRVVFLKEGTGEMSSNFWRK